MAILHTKSYLWLLVMLILASFVSAEYCYQETANASHVTDGDCLLNYSGAYVDLIPNASYPTEHLLAIDGNWSTAFTITPLTNKTIRMNYTKPVNAVSAIWQTKDQDYFANRTIPVACFNQNPLRLEWRGRIRTIGDQIRNWDCYNGSEYIELASGYTGFLSFYEEGIFWNLSRTLIDNCSTFSNGIANFTVWYEDYVTNPLKSNISYYLNYSFEGINYNLSSTIKESESIKICANNIKLSPFDIYLQSSNGFVHRFYLTNASYVRYQINNSIYNFNTTTDISLMQLTVRDFYSNNYLPNIIVKLQRYYPGTGTWITVQEYKTDSFGLALFNIIEAAVDYRIIFQDTSNNVYATTDPMAFSCNSFTAAGRGVCQLTYQLDTTQTTTISNNVQVAPKYYPSANQINITWTDPTAGTNTVISSVTTETWTGSRDLCGAQQTGAAGFLSCNVSGYSGAVLVQVISNGEIITSEYVTLNSSNLGKIIGEDEGAFWAGIISITVAMFGIAVSPVLAVISTVVGLIAIYYLGIFSPLTVTFVILAAVLSIAISWRLRN